MRTTRDSQETEQAWSKETGWSLLHLACAINDVGSVRHIIKTAPARELKKTLSSKVRVGLEMIPILRIVSTSTCLGFWPGLYLVE